MGQIFLKLIDLSIMASILAGIAILFRVVFKKAPKFLRVVMWGLVALRLIVPFTIETQIGLAPKPNVESAAIEHIAVEPNADGDDRTSDVAPVMPSGNAPGAANDTPAPPVSAEDGERLPTPDAAAEAALSEEALETWRTVVNVAAVVWAIVAAAMLVYAGGSYARIRRKVRAAIQIEKNVWICDYVDTPFILGFFKPRIYLPSEISSEDARLVIAHEKAHIARLDHIWKPIGFLLMAIYWFNPVMWISFVLFTHDIEFACDERVLRRSGDEDVKRSYSTALVNCSAAGRAISPCPIGFAEVSVRERVRDVLHYKKPTVWIMTAAIIAIFVTAACLLTSPLEKAGEVLYERRTDYDDFSYYGGVVYEKHDNVILDHEVPNEILAQIRDLREADFMVYGDSIYARNFLRDGKLVTDWEELGALERDVFIDEENFDNFLPKGETIYFDGKGSEENGSTPSTNTDVKWNRLSLRVLFTDSCSRARWNESDQVNAFMYLNRNHICLGYHARGSLPIIYSVRGVNPPISPTVTELDIDIDGDGEKDRVTLVLEKAGKFSVYRMEGRVGNREVSNRMYFEAGERVSLAEREFYDENGVWRKFCTLNILESEEQLNGEAYYMLSYNDGRFTAYRLDQYTYVKGITDDEAGDVYTVIRYVDPAIPEYRSVKDLFWEDGEFEYCFTYKKSDEVEVTTADGRVSTLAEAMRDGVLDLDSLLEYPMNEYWKINKKTREYLRCDAQGKVIWSSAGNVDNPYGSTAPKVMRENYNTYGYTTFDIDGDGAKEYIALGYGPNSGSDFPESDLLFTVTVERGGKRIYFDIFRLPADAENIAMRLNDDNSPYIYTYEWAESPENRKVKERYDISVADGHIVLSDGKNSVPYWDGLWGY